MPALRLPDGIVGEDAHMKVHIIGMGMGNPDTLTVGAKRAIEDSDLLIGAPRLLEPFDYVTCEKLELIKSSDIVEALASAACDQVSILMSGDVGFYSGAAGLYERLGGEGSRRVLCAD